MVYLNPPATEDYAGRQLRSSSYYKALKKFGRLKTDVPVRTASYEKHLLPHTDITGGGHGNSYPHRKDFAWNLLYLKQSWGSNIPLKPDSKASGVTSKSTSRATERHKKQGDNIISGAARKSRTAPAVELPRLTERASRAGFQLAATEESKRGERKRQTAGSQRSKATLDSIPEDEPLTSPQSRCVATEKSSKRRHVISSLTKASRLSRRSRRTESRFSASSSVMSSRLPSVNSEREAFSSATTTRSYENQSRLSSVTSRSTQWDEHEGRPAAEKLAKSQAVARTIRPELLKTLVRGISDPLSNEPQHLDSTSVASALGSSVSAKRHQPFTNLSFEVEKSATTTRLRSSLYKTEEAQRRPTIFRSNLTEVKKHKCFNPRHHSDITRPVMIDKHAHKHPLDGYSSPKWTPKLSGLLKGSNGPWTTYDTR